jgi:uncharacterized protein YjbI with pentapeptide repeats
MTIRYFLSPSLTMKLVALAATLSLSLFMAHGALAAPKADPVPRELLDHCIGCDAHGMDLHGRDLHGIRLIGANLSGADLRGANLRGASLTGCDLHNAKLDGADLTDAKLTGVSLEGATFAGAKLQGMKLTGVSFRGAPLASAMGGDVFFRSCTGCDLSRAILHDMDFSRIQMIGSNLRDANLRGTKFTASRLTGADLRSSDATNADFSGAHLVGVDLRGANLSGASLRDAVICYPSRTTSHDGIVTTSGDISCIDLRGATLRGADLRGVKYCVSLSRMNIIVRSERKAAEARVVAPEAPRVEVVTDGDRDCRPLSADELRMHSHADLGGARLN